MNKWMGLLLMVAMGGVVGGCQKKACLDACEPKQAQMDACAKLEGDNKKTCEESIKKNAEACKKVCEDNY